MSLPSAKKLLLIGQSFRDPDADALMARMTVQPNGFRRNLIGKVIIELKKAGVWSLLDGLYFVAAHDEQAGRLNWRRDVWNCEKIGAGGFTKDKGLQSAGGRYLRSGFNPRSSGGLYNANSSHVALFGAPETATNAGYDSMGVISQPNENSSIRLGLSFQPSGGGQSFVAGTLNSGGNTNRAPGIVPGKSGLGAARCSTDAQTVSVNGGTFGADNDVTAKSSIAANGILCIGSSGINPFSGQEVTTPCLVHAASFGAMLSDQNVADLHRIMRAYLSRIGALQ